MVGAIFAAVGTIFLAVGLYFVWVSFDVSRQIDQIESLPVLSLSQLNDTPLGTEAVIEGSVAERNPLHVNGFVAYVSFEYQGERCTTDDDGYQDCEDIWLQQESLTPNLWLDLPGGRARLSNTDYYVENAPVTWQTTETLVEYETLEYEGFKINNPVFIVGTVAKNGDIPAFNAEFIYGGDRDTYLSDERDDANGLFWFSIAFSTFGGVFVVIGGALLLFGILG
jgi:hypothetical protein